MPKIFLAILVFALLGYVVYQNRTQLKSALPGATPARTAVATPASAHPAKPGSSTAAPALAMVPAGPASPLRAQMEPLLKPLKVSSIMLGDPSIVIINKQDYGVGDALKLAGGKPVVVRAIDENGVTLACENETFHLDAPAAPDLAATRKKL